MKIYNIVLTGGPASGKTTILKEIKEKFDTDKTKVIIVPEIATELFGWNIPILIGDKAYIYQDNVYQKQKNHQKIANSLAKELDYEKILIIYDRAVLDNKAYLDNKAFKELLDKNNDSELENLDYYDLVINLQSSANLDNKYEKETNPARSEDADMAVILGNKTLNAWLMHRNLYNVLATDDINDKISSVNTIIDNFVNKKRIKKTSYLIDYQDGKYIAEKTNAQLINEDDYYYNFPLHKYCLSVRNDNNSSTFIERIFKPSNDEEIVYEEKLVDQNYTNEIFLKGTIKSQVKKQICRFVYEKEVFEIIFVDDLCFLKVLSNTDINNLSLPIDLKFHQKVDCQDYYDLITKPSYQRKLL